MTDSLREQIAANLRTMSTDELLALWVTNDRTNWSDTAFEAAASILTERGVTLPEQNPPVAESEVDDESEEELEDEPQGEPVFYRPDEVFSLARTIGWLAPTSVVITVLGGVPSSIALVRFYSQYFPDRFLATLITVPLGIVVLAVQCALVYFGLKALSAVLRMLMEMEFDSRGARLEEVEEGGEVESLAA